MQKNIYEEFLELCAFEPEEITEILPQWIKAADHFGLTEEDIRFAAEEWIPSHWDIQYQGIRKMIGAYIRELIELSKAREYKEKGAKIVYGIIPAIITSYRAMKYSGGDQVFVSFPDALLVTVLNSFFHKANPYLECAEEHGFTYGCRHCALNKTRIAARWENVIPAPDVIWSWGFNCDEGPKTDEYIQCLFDKDWRYVISRLPHDTNFGEADDELDDRVEFVAMEIKDGLKQIEEITGIKITEEHMKKALEDSNRYAFKNGMLVSLMSKADPVPLGGSDIVHFQQPLGIPFNTGVKYLEEAIDLTIKEVRAAIKEGKGVVPKGAPKVAFYGVPVAVPWVDRMFRENGVAPTVSFNLSPSRKMLTPLRHSEPYMATAEQWLRMPMGMNMRSEADTMIQKIKDNKPDAVIMGFFDFDRWLGAQQKMAAKICEEETGVPHYYIEGDCWEDRDYSPEALRTRIESISQILKLKKLSQA